MDVVLHFLLMEPDFWELCALARLPLMPISLRVVDVCSCHSYCVNKHYLPSCAYLLATLVVLRLPHTHPFTPHLLP